jgi:hypothetical protein
MTAEGPSLGSEARAGRSGWSVLANAGRPPTGYGFGRVVGLPVGEVSVELRRSERAGWIRTRARAFAFGEPALELAILFLTGGFTGPALAPKPSRFVAGGPMIAVASRRTRPGIIMARLKRTVDR